MDLPERIISARRAVGVLGHRPSGPRRPPAGARGQPQPSDAGGRSPGGVRLERLCGFEQHGAVGAVPPDDRVGAKSGAAAGIRHGGGRRPG